MVEVPSVIFLNCLGSYFYSIIELLGGESYIYQLLLYLAKGTLCYKQLDMNMIRKKYQNNPWGYQPVQIINSNGKLVSINDDFLKYIFENLGISTRFTNVNQKKDLWDILKSVKDKKVFVVCAVDEYYLPTKTFFFQKRHNKHFLLIRSVDYSENIVEVIDSECTEPKRITFIEFEKAILESVYQRLLLMVDCTGATDQYLLRRTNVEEFSTYKLSSKYIMGLEEDIIKNINNHYLHEYFFRGYYYNIISKIIPYLTMLHMSLRYYRPEIIPTMQKHIQAWDSLGRFMQFKSIKGNFSLEPLIDKLEGLAKQGESFY